MNNNEIMRLADAYAEVSTGAVPDADRYKIGLRIQEARAALEAAIASLGDSVLAQGEPVAWIDDGGMLFWKDKPVPDGTDLYTHPATVNTAMQTITDFDQMREATEHLARRIKELEAQNAQMRKALIDIAYGLESARVWGGMDWTYHPLHPVKYLPLRDKARAAIAQAEKEMK